MKIWNYVHTLQDPVALFSTPDENSAVIQELAPGTVLHLCEFNPKWCEVCVPNSSHRGFVRGNIKMFFRLSCVLHGSDNALYKAPEPSSGALRQLHQGECVVLNALVNKHGTNWIKLTTSTGEEGYLDHIPMTSSSQRLSFKEDGWTCPGCFKINRDANRKCPGCGRKVPGPDVAPGRISRVLAFMANLLVLLYVCLGIGILGGLVAAARQSVRLPWLEGTRHIGFVLAIFVAYIVIGLVVVPPLLRLYEAGQSKSKK